MSRRLLLFVEGPSDGPAVGNLVNRLLLEAPDEFQGLLYADEKNAYKVGNVPKVSGARGQAAWLQRLARAQLEPNLGGVLVVLDGDEDFFEDNPFCPSLVGRTLAERARTVGAGSLFSLAVVILRQEFESLLIAGASQLPNLKANVKPESDPEAAPRGAKRWLHNNLEGGYKESEDQLTLTRALNDWTPLRRMRSFQRLEKAVRELVTAAATGAYVCTPGPPPAAPHPPAAP